MDTNCTVEISEKYRFGLVDRIRWVETESLSISRKNTTYDLLGWKLYIFDAPKTIRLLIIEFNLNLKSLAQMISKKEKCFQ